jgi:hypothetical protein
LGGGADDKPALIFLDILKVAPPAMLGDGVLGSPLIRIGVFGKLKSAKGKRTALRWVGGRDYRRATDRKLGGWEKIKLNRDGRA